MDVVPALLVTTKQVLPSVKDFSTYGPYGITDVTLHVNSLDTNLDIDDARDANVIVAASHATCCTLGLTFTFTPRNIVPQGSMVVSAKLPTPSSL